MSFQITFDQGPHPRAQLGFIAVANADITERDMFKMCPDNIGLHFTRVKMPKICTIDSLAAMETDLDNAIETLMPGRSDVDVICYNCTAGSFVIGEQNIADKINAQRASAFNNTQGTTLLTGVTKALKTMGISKIALGTAYTDDINQLEAQYFSSQGIECVSNIGLGLKTDMQMNKVSPNSLLEFAQYVDRPEAEAVFLSCGALRSIEIIEEAEQRLGKPVLSSNQASLWHCLRLAGVKEKISRYGTLMRDY